MNEAPQTGTGGLRTVFRGAGVSYLAQLYSTALSFAHTVALARFYRREGLGLYSTGFPLTRYLTILGALGLNNAIVRFVPIHRHRDEPEKVAAVLGWSIRATALASGLLGVLLWLLADVISVGVFEEPRLGGLLRVFAFAVPTAAISSVISAASQAYDRQGYRALPSSVIEPTVQLGLVLLFGWMGYSVVSAVAARGWALACGLIAAALLQRRLSSLGLRSLLPGAEARELGRFALPACTAGLLMAVGSSLALLMTTALAGREETGLYAVGHRVTFIGILMLRSFTWSFDPFVSRLLDAKDTVGLRRLLRAVTKALLAVNLPVACLVVLLAEPVVALFGSDFGPAVTCMRILAVDSVIVSLAYLADHLVLFSGRSSLAMANNFGLVAVAFVLDLVLIPRMGAEGAAWASLASHTAFLVVCALQVALLVRLTFFGVAQLNIVLTAAAATAAGFGVQYFLLPGALGSVGSLIVAGTFAVVYAPLLLLVLTPGDRAMIRRALKVARRPDPGA